MLKSFALIVPVLGALAISACQPEPTPEQKAAAALQDLLKGVAAAAGGDPNAVGQIDPNALGAAMAQAGAIAGALAPEMTAEDRAAMNAAIGSMTGGPVHPAASAYVGGMDKAFTIISGVKDDAGVEAARPQLAAIYAEMAGPAATLKAMSDADRQVAFGSSWTQLLGFSMKAMGLMMPLSSNPELAEKVSDLLESMPAAQ